MICISDILKTEHVNLTLTALDSLSAVQEVLFPLRGDIRVTDWDALREAVIDRDAPAIASNGCGIIIAHGRTNAVNALTMSAARLIEGIQTPHIPEKVRLVFVAGIPTAFNNEYLRVVGTIARLCSKPTLLEKLLLADHPLDFLDILAREETKL